MSLEISAETTFLLDMVNPVYGSELHTSANAASDPNGNEADATTGFTQSGINTFQSQAGVKNTGSYAIEANANPSPSANCRFHVDLSASPFNLLNGDSVKISFAARHIGAGDDWNIFLGANSTTPTTSLLILSSADTSFQSIEYEFTFGVNTVFFSCIESGATNNGGIYFDNFSVKKKG